MIKNIVNDSIKRIGKNRVLYIRYTIQCFHIKPVPNSLGQRKSHSCRVYIYNHNLITVIRIGHKHQLNVSNHIIGKQYLLKKLHVTNYSGTNAQTCEPCHCQNLKKKCLFCFFCGFDVSE